MHGSPPPRRLTSDLLLLAYRPDTGRPLVDSGALQRGLAGAQIVELLIAGRVRLDRDRLYALRHTSPTGDFELDGLAARISAEWTVREAGWWVRKIDFESPWGRESLRRRMLDRAVAEGVLAHERGRIMGVFPTDDYRPLRPGAREAALDSMRSILQGDSDVDVRWAALIRLVRALRLDDALLRDIPSRRRRRMIRAVAEREDIAPAVRLVAEAVESMEKAVQNAGGGDGGGGGGDDGGGGSGGDGGGGGGGDGGGGG